MKILLYPNSKKNIPAEQVGALVDHLANRACTVLADESFSDMLSPFSDKIAFVHDVYDADAVFVLGGDGTMIKGARAALDKGIPLAGINYGHLGYMTELEIGDTDMIDKIISGECRIESRMMIDVRIKRDGKYIEMKYPALNDAVISNGPVAHLMRFDMYCDGTLARRTRGDGVVISTPTGSTAYSMSAGGPVLDPCLKCICATYVCPHSLGARSVIFGGGSVITIKNISCRSTGVYLTIDGREETELLAGDEVIFSRSLKETKFIRVKNDAFLSVLRQKMSDDLI